MQHRGLMSSGKKKDNLVRIVIAGGPENLGLSLSDILGPCSEALDVED